MLVLILIASAVFYFFFYHLYWKRLGLPPGPTPWPFLGNMPGLIAKAPGYEALKDWTAEYGPVYTFWFGRNPLVTVNDYHLLNESLVKDGSAYADRFIHSEILRLYRGGEWGVIDTSGPVWQEHRRFALKTLRDFGMGKNLMEQKILAEVDPMVRELKALNGETVNLHQHLDQAVGSIINNTLFGYRFDSENIAEFRKLRSLLEKQSRVLNTPAFLLLMLAPPFRNFPYLRGAWKTIIDCRDSLFHFLRNQMMAHEGEIDYDTEHESNDICEEYLRERRRRVNSHGDEGHYSLKQLENLLFDLWVGGLETTTGNLGWAVVFLLHHPEVQERMRTELEAVIGTHAQLVHSHSRTQLPYCGAVLMELQRTANILPMNLPRATTRDVTIGGFRVKIFPDPHAFNPHRFLNEEGQLKICDEWMPFSVGARRCPGESLARMELFLFLTNLVYHFHIRPESPDKLPSMKKTATCVQKPENFLVKLIPMDRS